MNLDLVTAMAQSPSICSSLCNQSLLRRPPTETRLQRRDRSDTPHLDSPYGNDQSTKGRADWRAAGINWLPRSRRVWSRILPLADWRRDVIGIKARICARCADCHARLAPRCELGALNRVPTATSYLPAPAGAHQRCVAAASALPSHRRKYAVSCSIFPWGGP